MDALFGSKQGIGNAELPRSRCSLHKPPQGIPARPQERQTPFPPGQGCSRLAKEHYMRSCMFSHQVIMEFQFCSKIHLIDFHLKCEIGVLTEFKCPSNFNARYCRFYCYTRIGRQNLFFITYYSWETELSEIQHRYNKKKIRKTLVCVAILEVISITETKAIFKITSPL